MINLCELLKQKGFISKEETNLSDGNITMENLPEHGQTIMFSELPDRLWATTGYKILPLELYNNFGRVRNQIIHFAVPNISLSDLTLTFTFEIIEKAINNWWDITILDYVTDYDDAILESIFDLLKKLKLKTNYKLDQNLNLKRK